MTTGARTGVTTITASEADLAGTWTSASASFVQVAGHAEEDRDEQDDGKCNQQVDILPLPGCTGDAINRYFHQLDGRHSTVRDSSFTPSVFVSPFINNNNNNDIYHFIYQNTTNIGV